MRSRVALSHARARHSAPTKTSSGSGPCVTHPATILIDNLPFGRVDQRRMFAASTNVVINRAHCEPCCHQCRTPNVVSRWADVSLGSRMSRSAPHVTIRRRLLFAVNESIHKKHARGLICIKPRFPIQTPILGRNQFLMQQRTPARALCRPSPRLPLRIRVIVAATRLIACCVWRLTPHRRHYWFLPITHHRCHMYVHVCNHCIQVACPSTRHFVQDKLWGSVSSLLPRIPRCSTSEAGARIRHFW